MLGVIVDVTITDNGEASIRVTHTPPHPHPDKQTLSLRDVFNILRISPLLRPYPLPACFLLMLHTSQFPLTGRWLVIYISESGPVS